MNFKWIDATLGYFVEFSNGRTSPERLDSAQFPVYGSNGVIGFSDDVNAPENCIIIGRVGSYCGSVYHSEGKCWVTDNAILALPKYEGESEFWYFLMLALDLNTYRSGSGQPLLNQATLKSVPINVPDSPSVRSGIGKQLMSFDVKIELNRQTNQTLEQIAQAIFKSWFVDFEPTRAKIIAKEQGANPVIQELAAQAIICGAITLEQLAEVEQNLETTLQQAIDEKLNQHKQTNPTALNAQQLKTTAALFPNELVESELGDVPEGWIVDSFSVLAKLDTTSVKPNEEPERIWEHYSIPAFDVDESPVYELGKEIKSNKYKVNPNAILTSKLNPHTPRTWWPDTKEEGAAICSTEFMQFIPLKTELRAFILGVVLSKPFQEGIQQRVTGSTGSRQRAQPKQVAGMEVLVPDVRLMRIYSKTVKSFYVQKSKNIKENLSLGHLRDTLLPKLLSGELSLAENE